MHDIVTIITPTYNKEEFLSDAAEGVFSQTYNHWQWWIILDGANKSTIELAESFNKDDRVSLFTERADNRQTIYRPAVIADKYFSMVTTKYFCWLSDDDIFEDCFLKELVEILKDNPNSHVAYGCMERYIQKGDDWILVLMWGCPKDKKFRFGPKDMNPDYKLDGGQILQTKESYDNLIRSGTWNWSKYYDKRLVNSYNHCDGLYLNALSRIYKFIFVDKLLLKCRSTYLSSNIKGKR